MADVTPMKTAAEQALSSAYEGARAKLPGKDAVAALRDEAFKRFDAAGLPHRRIEEWKYTDLRALMRDALPLASPPDAAAKARAKDAGRIFASLDTRRLVFADGSFVPELSDLTPEKGITITSMAEALAKGDALVAKHVGKVFETDDAAVALNTALMGDGAVIQIAAELKRPIHLIFATGDTPSASFTRSLIVIEKDAKALIAESHDGGGSQVNSALELVIGDGAQVDYFKAVNARGLHVGSLLLTAGAKAAFNTFAFDAEADNKPELEIFADDVVCGHGATAGALDPGLKFYLMSRGIDEAQAEALLIQAFIGETVEEIAHEGFRDALMNAALAWLESRK